MKVKLTIGEIASFYEMMKKESANEKDVVEIEIGRVPYSQNKGEIVGIEVNGKNIYTNER